MIRRAYTSTVVGTVQMGFGLLCAAAVAVGTAAAGVEPWVTAVSAAAVVLAAVHLSTVRIGIGTGQVQIGQGPWNRPARHVDPHAVVAGRTLELGWAQTFGIGTSWHRKTTRLTVRPGPTLELELDGGEHIRISIPDPDTARQLLPTARQETP